MQDLIITPIQTTQVWEDKAANLAHFEALLQGVHNTDLILLPEMFHTGFTMNAEALAETMDDSMAVEWLKAQAASKNVAFYTSFIARENNQFFNRGIFVYPSGELKIYDKRQLFSLAGEDQVYTAGSAATIVEFKGWKLQLQVCYDLRFPEITRNYLTANQTPLYDVMLYIANWPQKRSLHWKALLTARAIENQCYTVGLNRVGKDNKELDYSGDSRVTNALGEEISNFKSGVTHIENIALSPTHLATVREQLAFLKDASVLNFKTAFS